MRKTRLILLILLAIDFQLSAQIYNSNQLGQLLSVTETISSEGYCIDVQDNVRTLYLNGEVVSVQTSTVSNGSTYIIEKNRTDTVTRQYDKGLLRREITESDSFRMEYVFTYINNRLAFCSIFTDDQEKPSEIIFFLRSSETNEPIAINHNNEISFVNDNILYQNGTVFELLNGTTVIEGEYSVSEDGEIVIIEDDTTYYYSADGILLRSVSEKIRTEYEYEDNVILKTTSYQGDSYAVTLYSDGNAIELQSYENGDLTSKTVYKEDGNVQTIYKNGRAIATVFYKEDNRTVDRIEYN